MPLTVRKSARRRRRDPDEKLPGRSRESAQVMAPTRMKLRVRCRGNVAGDVAAGGSQPEEGEGRSQESSGRSSRRKNASSTSTAAASFSPLPSSSASASAQAAVAAEEASPDSKCPICLDRFNNLAYLDRCLHRFCFPCIQEWSHNKAECPLCKQPFASILHSVRAEDDFKEYTLRPAPANSSVAATVAMVAAMASAARSHHQMRLLLRRHRGVDAEETTVRRRRRERGGRGRGGSRMGEGAGVWEWYLDSPPLSLAPLSHRPATSPVVAEESEEADDSERQQRGEGADRAEHGVIFEGLTGLGGTVAPVAPNGRESRRLMTRLAARQRLQQEGGSVRRARERETVAFRRALYRCGVRVRGAAGVDDQGQQERDVSAESFRRNPILLNRLRPWLRRELTVLYGAHGSLVDIVQRIIMARLARYGLEDTPTIEEELRPFLLARTDHFLHELVSFARSPLSLENYDLQAVYEPPAAALELDGISSSSESSSVIAISEGEEEDQQAGGDQVRLPGRTGGSETLQTGNSLSFSVWDDETPGPSYSTAEPLCPLAPQEAGGKQEEEGEEECLIVGYKKPIAERTPELVKLSSDTEEEEDKEKKEEEKVSEKLPVLPSTTPPLSYLPIIPPSTSDAYRNEQEEDGEAGGCRSRAPSWSGSSERSRKSVCAFSPRSQRRGSWRDRKQSASEVAKDKRRRKRSKRGQEKRKSGTLYNPNRCIYPAMMHHRSRSSSPFHSSVQSSPPDSSWEYHCSQVSPLNSSLSSPSRSSWSSSPHRSSPKPATQRPPAPSVSPGDRGNTHHGEKPGGKRKYKSRHLDSDNKDPTWRPSSSHLRERRKERREERRRKRRDDRRRERQRRASGGDGRKCREDRSPSVEIIYEGTIANTSQPPAHKRRRKRHRRTQHGSSPVIITLDSDSSHKDVNNNNNSSSSSPLSSQQTVDFSDLPPLPLLHSGGVAQALNEEIGELPVDILDQGSGGSDTEPATGPIAIDHSDCSDHSVDVESVQENGSPLGSEDDKAPASQTVDTGFHPTIQSNAAATTMELDRDSEVSTSDSHLLATILNDLKGIAASKCSFSLSFEPNRSSDTKPKHFRDQSEVTQSNSNQENRSAETRPPSADLPEELQSNESREQNQGADLPAFLTSGPPLPQPEGLKERRVREEATNLPPLVKQASPVSSCNRNTPRPLKHKDAASPHLLSRTDLHSPKASVDADPAAVNSHVDTSSAFTSSPGASCLGKDNQAIPAISTLKKHFTSMSAQRGDGGTKRDVPAADARSPSHLRPTDSHSEAPPPVKACTIHSTTLKPLTENSSLSADCQLHLDSNTFHSSRLHSGLDGTQKTYSGPGSSPVDLHPINSLSQVNFPSANTDRSKNKSAHTDSTFGVCRNTTLIPDSCRGAANRLHPSSSVSAEGTPTATGIFSGANRPNTSPTGFVLSIDFGTPPSSPIDSSRRRAMLSEKLPPSGDRSVLTTAASLTLVPSDVNCKRPKSAGLTDKEASWLVMNEERPPDGHVPLNDLHSTSPIKDQSGFVSSVTDGQANHTAFSPPHFQKSQSPIDSNQNCFGSDPQFPLDTYSGHNLPTESQSDSQPPPDPHSTKCQPQPPTDNHVTWPPQTSDIDAHSETQSAAGSNWNKHTHT